MLIGDFSRAVSILRRLKGLGVRISMDDFGTGYSSLSYLQSFPFDKIKIDRGFISNLGDNGQSAAIVRAVKGDHFALGEAFVYDLSAADVVLMRQDPPFDMAYITATHILERIHPNTLVVNDPRHVRNAPEKLFLPARSRVLDARQEDSRRA